MASAKTRGQRLGLRVFIEGIEVPAISASITYSVHGATSAYIQLVALGDIFEFLPRSVIEVYTLSDENRDVTKVRAVPNYRYEAGAVKRSLSPVSFANSESPVLTEGVFAGVRISKAEAEIDVQYDLEFGGELVGYTFYEDSQSRTVNLMCLDFSNNLDTITQYTYDVNAVESMGGLSRATFLSGYSDGSIRAAYRDQDYNATLAKDMDITLDGVPGAKEIRLDVLVGGVIGLDQRIANVLAQLGLSAGIKAIFNSIAGAYYYYKELDHDLNLRDQLYISEDDDTRKIFQTAQYVDYIFGYRNRYGSLNSLKNLLKIIFKLTHFEFCSLPGGTFYRLQDFSKLLAQDGATASSVAAAARNGPLTSVALRQTLLKPELHFAEPPACNLVFPDEVYTINVSRHFLSEPTRGVEFTDHVVATEDQIGEMSAITNTYTITPAMAVEAGNVWSYAPQQMVGFANQINENLANFGQVLLPEEVYKGIMPLNGQTNHILRSAYLTNLNHEDSGSILAWLFPDSEVRVTDKTVDFFNKNFDPAALTEIKKNFYSFFMRETNYKFLQARFQSRSAQVSCKLLTRIVPGFPALIMEKDPFRLEPRASNLTVPRSGEVSDDRRRTTFLGFEGYVAQVTHFISQAGGVTTLTLSHTKPTNEKLDFFDISAGRVPAPNRIIPDYRILGTAPWATKKYGPGVISKTYADWLGGLDWQGQDISHNNPDYLGMLPLTQAILKMKAAGIPEQNLAKYRADTVGNYLQILYDFSKLYALTIRNSGSRDDTVEQVFRDLVRRPRATRLAMRGYLTAYQQGGNVPRTAIGNPGTRDSRTYRHDQRAQAVRRYIRALESTRPGGGQAGGGLLG